MSIGTSLVLIAVGVVLRFAVTIRWHATTVNWYLIGDIVMAVGAAGLLVSLVWLAVIGRRPGSPENTPTR